MNASFLYNGANLSYEVHGSGETIVFIHGFSLDSRMWLPQIQYFSKKYHCVAFDMRGYGKSSLPNNEYSYQDDIKALMDHLDIDKAHIVGLSLGGEEALNFALDNPNRIKTLTLVSSSLGGYSSTVNWDVRAKEDGLEIAKKNWLNHPVFASSKMYPEALKQMKTMIADYSGWHWLNSGYRSRPVLPAVSRLKEISHPVLIVTGELDLKYYHDIAKILQTNIRDNVCVSIDESGHMLTLEQPERFNSILENFISS